MFVSQRRHTESTCSIHLETIVAYLQFTPREIEVKCNVFGMEKIDRT